MQPSTRHAAIAATGSIMMAQPQRTTLNELVPPTHIVVVKQSQLADNLLDLMQQQQWQQGMPTNLVLVSGPLKHRLGASRPVHMGPKALIVLFLTDC